MISENISDEKNLMPLSSPAENWSGRQGLTGSARLVPEHYFGRLDLGTSVAAAAALWEKAEIEEEGGRKSSGEWAMSLCVTGQKCSLCIDVCSPAGFG